MMALFEGYSSASGTHGEPNRDPGSTKWAIKKTAKTLSSPVTIEFWEQHLLGKRPLGVVTIRDDSTCLWGSIDIDDYNVDHLAVIKKVRSLNLPLVPCRSKSNGLHLFIFFSKPVSAVTVQLTLRNLAAILGFADSEIFPKQTKILANDSGSWMVMPYFGGDFGGKLKMQYGLKVSGAEMSLREFIATAEASRITEDQLAGLRERGTTSEEELKKNGKDNKHLNGKGREKKPFSDGPPCLQFMAEGGFPEVGRNNALFHIGVFLKKAHPTKWKEMLETENQLYMRPPLPSDEVEGLKSSLEKKEYEYKCKEQPMVRHCDANVCRTRKYGVGNDVYPQIKAMRKMMSDPPEWFVDLESSEGTVTLCLRSGDLLNYNKFQQVCVDRASMLHKHLGQSVWTGIVQEAMKQSEEIDVSPDTGPGGRFLELIETFLTNRQRGHSREDLLRGVSWEDEESGRFYFKLADLQKFLEREGLKLTRSEMTSNIKRLHNTFDHGKVVGNDLSYDPKFSAHVGMRIKDKFINTWWVPSSMISATPEIDPPGLARDEI